MAHPRNPKLVWHAHPHLIKECVDLSVDTIHIKDTVVLFGLVALLFFFLFFFFHLELICLVIIVLYIYRVSKDSIYVTVRVSNQGFSQIPKTFRESVKFLFHSRIWSLNV